MAGVIRFAFSGIQDGLKKIGQLKESAVKTAQSFTAKGGGARVGGGLMARVGASGGMGPIGQLGSALGSPMGVLGGAAVAAGLALRALRGRLDESIAAIQADAAARTQTAAALRGAVGGANSSALAATLGRRQELIGGARGTPEMREKFSEWDRITAQIESAQLNRALDTGSTTLRSELGAVRSPESAALLEIGRAALAQVGEQKKISEELNGFQEFMRNMGHAFSGKDRNHDEVQASRRAMASAGGL